MSSLSPRSLISFSTSQDFRFKLRRRGDITGDDASLKSETMDQKLLSWSTMLLFSVNSRLMRFSVDDTLPEIKFNLSLIAAGELISIFKVD